MTQSVWIQVWPSVQHSFPDVRGAVQGGELVVSGRIRREGSTDRQSWVNIIVEGANSEGIVVISEESAIRMTGSEQRFVVRVPFKENLDWSVRSPSGSGALQRSIRRIGR